jgi:hypothetical protein
VVWIDKKQGHSCTAPGLNHHMRSTATIALLGSCLVANRASQIRIRRRAQIASYRAHASHWAWEKAAVSQRAGSCTSKCMHACMPCCINDVGGTANQLPARLGSVDAFRHFCCAVAWGETRERGEAERREEATGKRSSHSSPQHFSSQLRSTSCNFSPPVLTINLIARKLKKTAS